MNTKLQIAKDIIKGYIDVFHVECGIYNSWNISEDAIQDIFYDYEEDDYD